MHTSNFIPYIPLNYSSEETLRATQAFYAFMELRRSVRVFSDKDVPKSVIEQLILAASSAPSGAHKQPWTFCAVNSLELKKQIRIAAEQEEYANYHGRMSETWLEDLKPFGTDWQKPFLEIAPWLIVLFKKVYDIDEQGAQQKNYYVTESVGIAAGFLIAAIHHAGLVTLTHTPSPMNFLQKILQRPENERPFLLLPVGYPAEGVEVPNIHRKCLDEVGVFL